MDCVGVLFIGVCRVLGRLLSVACGMYRDVSGAWEIAVGSLWNVSVCVGGLGDCCR